MPGLTSSSGAVARSSSASVTCPRPGPASVRRPTATASTSAADETSDLLGRLALQIDDLEVVRVGAAELRAAGFAHVHGTCVPAGGLRQTARARHELAVGAHIGDGDQQRHRVTSCHGCPSARRRRYLPGRSSRSSPSRITSQRGALYCYTHLVAGLAAPQLELRPCAAEAQRHRDLLPGRRQVRVDQQRLVAALQAGEAHHRGLPEATHGGQVQAAGGVAHVVGEVDGGRHLEVLHGGRHVAEPRRHRGVDAGAQRAAVAGDRLVVVVVGARHVVVELVGQDVAEHHHVGLLDHLGAQGDLAAEHEVGGHRPGAQLLDGHVVHLVEAGELLEELRRGVEAVHEIAHDPQPLLDLGVVELEPVAQLLGVADCRRAPASPGPRRPCRCSSAPARWCRRCRPRPRGTRRGRRPGGCGSGRRPRATPARPRSAPSRAGSPRPSTP